MLDMLKDPSLQAPKLLTSVLTLDVLLLAWLDLTLHLTCLPPRVVLPASSPTITLHTPAPMQALRAAKVPLAGPGLLDALLRLHAQLSVAPDSLAAAVGALPGGTATLTARAAVAGMLCSWVEAGWKPSVPKVQVEAFQLHISFG